MSKLPGCNHTALIPTLLASANTCSVTLGGVMMETAVSCGVAKAERDGAVGYCGSSLGRKGSSRESGGISMLAEWGLIGVTGREWCRYQTNTTADLSLDDLKTDGKPTFMAKFGRVGGCTRNGERARRAEGDYLGLHHD